MLFQKKNEFSGSGKEIIRRCINSILISLFAERNIFAVWVKRLCSSVGRAARSYREGVDSIFKLFYFDSVAQLVEQLTLNQRV
jgi:hypothetical protein